MVLNMLSTFGIEAETNLLAPKFEKNDSYIIKKELYESI
jgi:hypothetical protein